MLSLHNFLLKTYYLKCLKSILGALVNISLYDVRTMHVVLYLFVAMSRS